MSDLDKQEKLFRTVCYGWSAYFVALGLCFSLATSLIPLPIVAVSIVLAGASIGMAGRGLYW